MQQSETLEQSMNFTFPDTHALFKKAPMHQFAPFSRFLLLRRKYQQLSEESEYFMLNVLQTTMICQSQALLSLFENLHKYGWVFPLNASIKFCLNVSKKILGWQLHLQEGWLIKLMRTVCCASINPTEAVQTSSDSGSESANLLFTAKSILSLDLFFCSHLMAFSL